jgi:hypothetical protein
MSEHERRKESFYLSGREDSLLFYFSAILLLWDLSFKLNTHESLRIF